MSLDSAAISSSTSHGIAVRSRRVRIFRQSRDFPTRTSFGFGRFTRQLVTALVTRATGFRYTLLFDQPPDERMPAGVEVLSAGTRRTLVPTALYSEIDVPLAA